MTDHQKKTTLDLLRRVFSLDLRSLALFRITAGILILVDLAFRWSTLPEMYTGEGFFTHQVANDYYTFELGESWRSLSWSLYWLSDSVIFVQTLFATAAIAALFLIVGKWTRLATIISWVLLVSLHARNPLITTSGDNLFRMMLFWSMFLPLGARWSFDSTSKTADHDAVFSFATIGFIFQLFAIYFFPGVAKFNDIWISGDAMSYVLRLDIYITDFGHSMLNYPLLLKLVSWVTLFAELIWVWTLFVPWKNGTFRLINMLVFCSLHIGVVLSMAIGLFSGICIVCWLALLPTFVWQRRTEPRVLNNLNFKLISTPWIAVECFCAVILISIVAWNVSNIENTVTRKLKTPMLVQLVRQAGVSQQFHMFGDPPKVNPWFVYEAKLVDGTSVDIFRDEAVETKRPENGLDKQPQFHWRRLHRGAVHSRREIIRQPMLDYIVKRWNKTHDDRKQVVSAKLTYFKEPIGPDFNELNFKSQVWGTYKDAAQAPGSLFDSMLDSDSPF